MLFPLKRMSPSVGVSIPVRTLKKVVFPAPLGPMIDLNSPFWTLKSTLWRAAKEPKFLQSFFVSRMPISLFPLLLPLLKEPPDPFWEKEDENQKDDAHEELPEDQSPDLGVDTDEHPEGHDDSGSDDGAEEGSHPPDQSHDDDISRTNPVQSLGEHIV